MSELPPPEPLGVEAVGDGRFRVVGSWVPGDGLPEPSVLHGGPCLYCGDDTTPFLLIWRMRAKPVGSYSLAGAASKVAAIPWPYLRCTACQHESEGKGQADQFQEHG